jgi:hypothetical protein
VNDDLGGQVELASAAKAMLVRDGYRARELGLAVDLAAELGETPCEEAMRVVAPLAGLRPPWY